MPWPDWARHIAAHLTYLENQMATNQEHLDAVVSGIGTAFVTAIQELKDQIAAGATPEQLDFTAADALVAQVQAEATADAPAAPPADGGDQSTPVDGSQPTA